MPALRMVEQRHQSISTDQSAKSNDSSAVLSQTCLHVLLLGRLVAALPALLLPVCDLWHRSASAGSGQGSAAVMLLDPAWPQLELHLYALLILVQ